MKLIQNVVNFSDFSDEKAVNVQNDVFVNILNNFKILHLQSFLC